MHFFILVIIVPLEFIDFLENLKEDFSRTGLVVLALVDKDFLEFAFYTFYYLLGVVRWHYLVVLAVKEDYRNVQVYITAEIYSERVVLISNSLS
jgi:hypothetical protein